MFDTELAELVGALIAVVGVLATVVGRLKAKTTLTR